MSSGDVIGPGQSLHVFSASLLLHEPYLAPLGEGGQLGGLERGLQRPSRLAEVSKEVRTIRSPEVWLSHLQGPKPAQLSVVLAKAPMIQLLGGE